MADPELTAEQLFGEALELRPDLRAAFLDQACRDAPELRRLVEELLRDNERVGSFLAGPLFPPDGQANPSTANFPVVAARFQPAQLIANRFLVVRFIARGGMGEVYEAKDQFLQGASMALKIIRPEIAADAASSSRFEQEVILASKGCSSKSLPHPRDISLRTTRAPFPIPHNEVARGRNSRRPPQNSNQARRQRGGRD
jgi:eukaryotic-like serine/threonine-protein kinase